MEFKYRVGDKLRCINSNCEFNVDDEVIVNSQVIDSIYNEPVIKVVRANESSQERKVYERDYWELVNSKSLHKTMEKKIFSVLVVNKKTGNTDKNQVVSAENEQSAILKAFGVDVENVFIKITEEGSYTEDKPVTAILVKENKEK